MEQRRKNQAVKTAGGAGVIEGLGKDEEDNVINLDFSIHLPTPLNSCTQLKNREKEQFSIILVEIFKTNN
jgi:hypothetical protein